MRPTTDWAGFWRELCQAQLRRHPNRANGEDVWRDRARGLQTRIEQRWIRPDSSRATVRAYLEATPGATLLDIGAGTGAWAAYLSPYASHITAMDPSPAMVTVMRENLAAQGVANVEIVQASWPEAETPVHDFSLCGHAMYGSPDLPRFIRRIEQVTRRLCFLLVRAPASDGVMAEAALRVWGHPHDSPNFQVAYNVLLEMGIRANVLFEDADPWSPRRHASLADALCEVKGRLLLDTGEHDSFLLDLLQRRLRHEDGELVWPRDMRSALVWWQSGER